MPCRAVVCCPRLGWAGLQCITLRYAELSSVTVSSQTRALQGSVGDITDIGACWTTTRQATSKWAFCNHSEDAHQVLLTVETVMQQTIPSLRVFKKWSVSWT